MQKENTSLRLVTLATRFLDWKNDWNLPFVVKNEIKNREKIERQQIYHRDLMYKWDKTHCICSNFRVINVPKIKKEKYGIW